MEAPNEETGEENGREREREIGTRAGRGIDIGGPGGDGDGTKGGRGGPEKHRGARPGATATEERGGGRGRPRHKYAEN